VHDSAVSVAGESGRARVGLGGAGGGAEVGGEVGYGDGGGGRGGYGGVCWGEDGGVAGVVSAGFLFLAVCGFWGREREWRNAKGDVMCANDRQAHGEG
jgi:hypothetical protein